MTSSAELNLGSAIDVRLELDHSTDPPVTRARFACRCGFVRITEAPRLKVPRSVRSHRAVCPFAADGQLLLGAGES